MNLNYKRHKLLGLLSVNKIKFETNSSQGGALGVSYEDIFQALNCDAVQLQHITSALYKEEEIGYHDASGIKGLFMKSDGLAAYSEKKYKKIHNRALKNNIKDVIQIFIPITSLLIAVLALSIKFNGLNSKTTTKIQAIEGKVQSMQHHIDSLQAQTKSLYKDSLTKE